MFHVTLRGSNCIESLLNCPSALQLTAFRFWGAI